MRGISLLYPPLDPAFDIAGLPDPFGVYFPVRITNLYTATIYITALLISPPAGWTDSEQNIATCSVGSNVRVEKSNATRAIMATPANEQVTVRYNYRTGGYAGPIIGFDDCVHTIYWEDITEGTIDDTDDFEDPPVDSVYDGWALTNIIGVTTLSRQTVHVIHGAYSLRLASGAAGTECYIEKTGVMGAGIRAYLFGFLLHSTGGYWRTSVVSPVETIEQTYQPTATWRRFGVRLNPGDSNLVRIYARNYWGTAGAYVELDYLRWVRY